VEHRDAGTQRQRAKGGGKGRASLPVRVGPLAFKTSINIHAVNHPAAPVNARLLVGYPVLVLLPD
jgi:hypothetical protein